MYGIEKGIPMPQLTAGPKAKYPFEEMEIGDSFFVPNAKSNRFSAAS